MTSDEFCEVIFQALVWRVLLVLFAEMLLCGASEPRRVRQVVEIVKFPLATLTILLAFMQIFELTLRFSRVRLSVARFFLLELLSRPSASAIPKGALN